MPACYAKGCRNSSSHGVKMSIFPRDPQRRAKWINICKKFNAITFKLPNDHSVLCEYHFTADMWEKQRVDGTKKLKANAEPTIFGDLVVQVVAKGKQNVPTKIYHPNTVMVYTNPCTKGIQILAQPDQNHEMLLVNGLTNEALKSEIIADISKDSRMKKSKVLTIAKKNTSLLLNSNAISSCIEDETSEASKTSINANDNISNDKLQADDDSDTDSFIDKNFEPVSDEEIAAKEEDYENFEPIDDEVHPNKDDYLSLKDKNFKADIITEEHSLHMSLKQLNKSASKTKSVTKCKRCERLEKACLKSERLRTMMKRNHKQTYAILKRKIQSLENKIIVLKSNHEGLYKILNEDQIDFLGKSTKKVYKWSEETLEKAYQYRLSFGRKGYQFLLDENWPLPTLRTLRGKEEEKRRIEQRTNIQTETIIDFE